MNRLEHNLNGRYYIFEIVKEFPIDYIVWNIGRHNFPFPEYVPLAKPSDIPFHIDLFSLKAIHMDEVLADYILREAHKREIGKDQFLDIFSKYENHELENYTFIVLNSAGKRLGKIECGLRCGTLPTHEEIVKAVKESFPAGCFYRLEKQVQ